MNPRAMHPAASPCIAVCTWMVVGGCAAAILSGSFGDERIGSVGDRGRLERSADVGPVDGPVDGLTAAIETFIGAVAPAAPPASPSLVPLVPRRAAFHAPADLRKPRPTKHRSERPTTLALDVAMNVNTREQPPADLGGGGFAAPMSDAIPAGRHRLPLLRPPAVHG